MSIDGTNWYWKMLRDSLLQTEVYFLFPSGLPLAVSVNALGPLQLLNILGLSDTAEYCYSTPSVVHGRNGAYLLV